MGVGFEGLREEIRRLGELMTSHHESVMRLLADMQKEQRRQGDEILAILAKHEQRNSSLERRD